MKISKLTELPLVPSQPDELVFVKNSGTVETYISNSSGDKFHKVVSSNYKPRLSLPSEVEVSKEFYFYITNYDTFHNHVITALRGTVITSSSDIDNLYSLDDDELYYIAPADVGEDIITINGYEYRLNITNIYSGSEKPSISYPFTEGTPLTISGSFKAEWTSYKHQGPLVEGAQYYAKKAIYQVSNNKRFHNILIEDFVENVFPIVQTRSKLIDLSSYSTYKTFYVRVRYVEGDLNDAAYEKMSQWSNPELFKWNNDQGTINGPYSEVAQYGSVIQSLNFEPKTYGSVLTSITVENGDTYVFVGDPSKSLNVIDANTGLTEIRNYQGTVSVYLLIDNLLSYQYELPVPTGYNLKLDSNDSAHRYFGFSLKAKRTISNDTLLVGSDWSVSSSSYTTTYHRYIFTNNTWTYVSDITTNIPFYPSEISISISDTKIAIGNQNQNLNELSQVGCVQIYNFDIESSNYYLQTTLYDTTPIAGNKFGSQVFTCNNGLFVTSNTFNTELNLPSRKVSYFNFDQQTMSVDFVTYFECVEYDNNNYKRFGDSLWATPDGTMVIVGNPSYVDDKGCFYVYVLSGGTFGNYALRLPDIILPGDQLGCFMDVAYNDIDNYCIVALSTKQSNKTYVYKLYSPGTQFYGAVDIMDDLCFDNNPLSNRTYYNGPATILKSNGDFIAVGSYIGLFDVNQNHRNLISLFQYIPG